MSKCVKIFHVGEKYPEDENERHTPEHKICEECFHNFLYLKNTNPVKKCPYCRKPFKMVVDMDTDRIVYPLPIWLR